LKQRVDKVGEKFYNVSSNKPKAKLKGEKYMAIQEGLAYWASITRPNTKFEPVYTVDLVIEDSVATDFESKGFKVKDLVINNESVGKAITIKRKVNGPNGLVRQAPKLVDANKNPMDELVGNGSRVKVQFNEWEVENKFGAFKGLDLQAVQVLDLISFKSGDGDEFDALEGGEEF
tara:strand:- start:197 stop:721 length:525 start_codon:yes stop_codon:yes gene_type:complete